MDSEYKLLREIWSYSPGRYVSLPSWDPEHGLWRNGRMFDKDEPFEVYTTFNPLHLDLYFSPLTYDTSEGGRRRPNISEAGVIFADMDDADAGRAHRGDLPFPNLIVASGSPGHEHWYWFLEESVPVHVWELYARGTTELLKGDPGGWDVTQVLRIPGTFNHKHPPPTQVQVLARERGTHSIYEFPRTETPMVTSDVGDLPPMPEVTGPAVAEAIAWAWPRLTVEDQLLIAGEERARDRSKVVWRMIRDWRDRLGFSEGTIFLVLVRAPFNKYPPEKLWAQIHK